MHQVLGKRKLVALSLELSGACNASCMFCTLGYKKDQAVTNVFTNEVIVRTEAKMSFDLIDSILAKYEVPKIGCTGVNEPFLAPDRIRYLLNKSSEHKFDVGFYTNGNLVGKSIAEDVLRCSQVNQIHFSLNATTNEVRQLVMGIPLDVAEYNLMQFLRLRAEMNREDIKVQVVMMRTPKNLHQQEDFIRRWEKVRLGFANVEPPGVFDPTNWCGDVYPYWMTKYKGKSGCKQWQCMAPLVRTDGQVYLCCYSSRWSFGHILDDDTVDSFLNRRERFNITDDTDPDQYPELCKECSHRFALAW